jgi:hypothetical protein
MRSLGSFVAALILALPFPAAAKRLSHDEAAGRVVAARDIARSCDGIGWLGGGDSQTFILSASDLLADQGYRRNKLHAVLFYAKTDSLEALGRAALAERGGDASDQSGRCRFGKGIAGKSDAIGQFLVRGE